MILKPDHIFYQSSSVLKQCVSGLQPYNINHFDYVRTYTDGGRIYLSSDPYLIEDYLKHNLYLQGNVEANPVHYDQQAVLWCTLPNQEVFQYEREHDIDNGVMLVKTQTHFNEYFSFSGSSKKHPELINFYLNNLDLLERFSCSFKEQTKNLLLNAEKEKIILPFNQSALKNHKVKDQCGLEVRLFELGMSHRLISCAKLLLTGATSKEIGKKMNLSFRTIDGYLEQLKYNLQSRNKAELLVKLAQLQHLI